MYDIIKRCIDLCIAVVLLVITSPLFFVFAIAIKAEDGGSFFYLQERVGKSHTMFKIIKFRSMREGSENLECNLTREQYNEFIKEFKLKNDPRITKVGAFLRESKLDELPQLLNVIFGQMAIVGPRPITLDELHYYTPLEVNQLLEVRPGLTGLWQVNDRNIISYENRKRQALELFYVEHRTSFLDTAILLKTLVIVAKKILSSIRYMMK